MFVFQAFAGITITVSPVGTSNQFPAKAANGGGTLALDSSNPSGTALLTIQGGVSQGIPARTAIGEIFKWSGDSSTLRSIDMVTTGSGGKGVYHVFLLDLGTDTFSTSHHVFAPVNHEDLLDADDTRDAITLTNVDTKSFVELVFSGSDKITLGNGHSYAFGLLSTSDISDLFIERSGGGASDPFGVGFTADSLDAMTADVSPFSASGVRNVFIGVYTAPVAEPPISMIIKGHNTMF